MNKVFLLLVLVIFSLSSCHSDKRNRFIGGELTVYYFDESEAKVAEEIAFFWKENGLLTGKKQDLQVRKDKDQFTVTMIASDPEGVKEMPMDEIILLSQLKNKLYIEVFDKQPFTLEIGNSRFETIYTVE